MLVQKVISYQHITFTYIAFERNSIATAFYAGLHHSAAENAEQLQKAAYEIDTKMTKYGWQLLRQANLINSDGLVFYF